MATLHVGRPQRLPGSPLAFTGLQSSAALAVRPAPGGTPQERQASSAEARPSPSQAVSAGIATAMGTIAGAACSRRQASYRGVGHVRREALATGAGAAAAVAAAAAIAQKGLEKPKGKLRHKSGMRPKVVVLGSGWGAATFLKGLEADEAQMYDITVVSPRNHFLYTPLLPTCSMGSVEERSIVTPMRRLISGKADFLEARCDSIDTVGKKVHCSRGISLENRVDVAFDRFPDKGGDGSTLTFTLDYDILVYAVGAQSSNFGCPGVKEHAYFFKEVSDARKVRERISDLFERAALPCISAEERDRLLSFVIVGGGPTGVEVAADLADFMAEDAGILYPTLVEHVKIRLINTGDTVLTTYDPEVSKKSMDVFKEKGVEVMSKVRVTKVTPDVVQMKSAADGTEIRIPYGCVVWAAGISENPLTAKLKESLIERNAGNTRNVSALMKPTRGIVTDEWMHVRGSSGSIFALGDACLVRHDRTVPFAKQLFEMGDTNGDGELDMSELRDLFKTAASQFPQLEAYSKYLDNAVELDQMNDPRIAALARTFQRGFDEEQKAFKKLVRLTKERVGDRTAPKPAEEVAADIAEIDYNHNEKLDFAEFRDLLDRVDKNLQGFPATAQVAAQQGSYLSKLFAKGCLDGTEESLTATQRDEDSFTYFHKGSLAYLGAGQAAFDVPIIGTITGPLAGLAWKFYETSAQLSWKNRALVGLNWVRTEVFGRDTSRF
mmetsp:Transcript_16212/g.46036  ORF Transcript_16212/g.46036 Transcript_16212/m.46036 type:complete len:722 (+) Transcript_16212:121-2286(+)